MNHLDQLRNSRCTQAGVRTNYGPSSAPPPVRRPARTCKWKPSSVTSFACPSCASSRRCYEYRSGYVRPVGRANDAPSSGLGIELGDHRHAGPVPVTPRASSAWLTGTPRPAPPSQPGWHAACQGPDPRAAARPKPPPPRRAPCLLAKNFRRTPPTPLTGPRHRPPPRSRRRRRPAKILGASTAPAAAVGGGCAGGAPDGRLRHAQWKSQSRPAGPRQRINAAPCCCRAGGPGFDHVGTESAGCTPLQEQSGTRPDWEGGPASIHQEHKTTCRSACGAC